MKNNLFLGVSAAVAIGLLSIPFVADALTPSLLLYFLVDVSSSNQQGKSNAIDMCHALMSAAQSTDEISFGQFANRASIVHERKVDSVEREAVCSSVADKRKGIGEFDGTDAGFKSILSQVAGKEGMNSIAVIAIDSTEQVHTIPADWITPAIHLLDQGIPLVFIGASLELEEEINSHTEIASHEMFYMCGEGVNGDCLKDAMSSARSNNGFDFSNLIGGH